MKVQNINKFNPKKIPVFVLTYIGLNHFLSWSESIRQHDDLQLVIVDNGSQWIPPTLDIPIFQTDRNIGCAGGWNLIAQLGFKLYDMEKIIIGQDDAMFDIDMIRAIWNTTSDEVIAGAYDRSFEFSLFGLSRSLWGAVGWFDENFIYVGCEDNDYKHRMKLANKRVTSLNYSADMNSNMSSRFITETAKPANEYNASFIKAKWGEKYEYTTPFNDPSIAPNSYGIFSGLVDVYGPLDKFPSILEFESI